MTTIAKFTKVTINKTMIFNQRNLLMDNNNKVKKGSKSIIGEVKGRDNQINFLASLEQCEGEFHGTIRTFNKFKQFFADNDIDVNYYNVREPFTGYYEFDFNFFN